MLHDVLKLSNGTHDFALESEGRGSVVHTARMETGPARFREMGVIPFATVDGDGREWLHAGDVVVLVSGCIDMAKLMTVIDANRESFVTKIPSGEIGKLQGIDGQSDD